MAFLSVSALHKSYPTPNGPVDVLKDAAPAALLAAVRAQVYARATAQDAGYGLETELAEPDAALIEAAAATAEALERLLRPLGKPRLVADQPYKWLMMYVEKG